MKLHRLIAIAICLCAIVNISLSAQTDKKELGFVARVQKVVSTEFLPVSRNDDRMVKQNQVIIVFDEAGNILEESLEGKTNNLILYKSVETKGENKIHRVKLFDDRGVLNSLSVLAFDKANQMQLAKYFDCENNLTSQINVTINEKGTPTSLTWFDADEQLIAKKVYTYENDKLALIETVDNSIQGHWKSNTVTYFDYDGKGNLTLVRNLTADGILIDVTEFKYNIKGDKIKSIFYPNYLSDSSERYENTYDGAGLLSKTTYYSPDNRVVRDENYSRSREGYLTAFAVYQDFKGDLLPDYVQGFNAKGNDIRRIRYDETGELYDFIDVVYKYDAYNNWVEKIEKSGREVIALTKRVITYY